MYPGRVPGSVEQIHVAAVESELPQPVAAVDVTADGVVGDTGIQLSPAEVRRQVLTRGIRLNDLVGERFTVGEVECVGQELCEPCNHLQGLTYPGVLRGLVHRGGLRADIVSGGRIAVGDEVMRVSSAVNG
jgi:MOSC domain-containing protein YiiM